MKNNSFLYGIVGLGIGALLTAFVMSNQNKQEPAQSTHMTHDSSESPSGMEMSMQDMMDSLKGKTGDEFDKAFISEMITHHQGAIDMAKEAQENAKHDEIKNLSQDIISAQEKEITQMRAWQKRWGYTQ